MITLLVSLCIIITIAVVTAICIPQNSVFNLNEYQEKPNRLSDLIIWNLLKEDGTIINKDGSFQKTFRFRGSDLDSATESELVITCSRINNVLKRLQSGWAIFVDAERTKTNKYLTTQFSDPISYLIDKERKDQFESGIHYESNFYITFLYLPPAEMDDKLRKMFINTNEKDAQSAEHYLKYFRTEANRMSLLFNEVLHDFEELSPEATLTYLHSTISNKNHPIAVPEIPVYLDAQLADTPIITGLEPKLGDQFIKAIGIRSYPGSTIPGILDALNRLGFEYRWSTRFIAKDKEDALKEITGTMRKWYSKRKSMATIIKEMISGTESIIQDSDAVNKANEADLAAQMLSDDLVSYGYYTCTVIVKDKDLNRVEKKMKAVEKAINSLGFTTVNETLNAFEAWLGSIPGHARPNIRRPLLSSMNLAHMLPISAIWAGKDTNDHLNQPPLIYCTTTGNTPFRFNVNIKDVGHTMVIGPTGAGKSVLLALMAASFRKYKNALVYCFDKGYSMLPLTIGVGGEFYDLAHPNAGLSFQPLSNIHEESELSWANEWILSILIQEKVEINPQIKITVWKALQALSTMPDNQRTITGLTLMLQDMNLRQALEPYTIKGSLGNLLDSDRDTLTTGAWQCFEMEQLMNIKTAIMPVLTYLFHRLEQRFRKGHPSILFLDEAWIYLDNPIFAAKIREWLKVLRKNDVYVIFASQSLADAENSTILSALIESCPTTIYLPNSKAQDDNIRKTYERFGLNERQIEILSIATPKRHYLYNSPYGSRLFELGMGDFALAYCTSQGKESYDAINKIIREHGISNFNEVWLKLKSETLQEKYYAVTH